MIQLPKRLASIDIFRALTMLLMIFVNDLWTLKGIPAWLEHTTAKEDGMGLADTVFPAFLFIVGLSIPFAIMNRRSKGASTFRTTAYILSRSLALLVMGFFHINLEHYSDTAFIPEAVWQIAITIGFFLVWLDYPTSTSKSIRLSFQACGILLLAVMAILYKGNDHGATVWMKPYWWGILGLIGWSYLLSTLIFHFSNGKFGILATALFFFLMFNIAAHAGWLNFLNNMKNYVWIAGDGSMPALTMAGVVTSMLYRQFVMNGKNIQGRLIIVILAILVAIIGFVLRPFWGISKIRATPSWILICSAISMICFVLLTYWVDERGKQNWFRIIKPAGTSTLTCYLLPYIHYGLYTIVGISLPLFLRYGLVGILKSLIYALLIILATGQLEKWRIRLKV